MAISSVNYPVDGKPWQSVVLITLWMVNYVAISSVNYPLDGKHCGNQ